MSNDKRPIIIVKKIKKGHGGHHGGSWKVAYADFVTAMMAFFMVMWILGMDDNVKSAVEAYFSNPVGMEKGYSIGSSPVSVGSANGMVQMKLISRAFEQQQYDSIGKKIEARLQGPEGLGQVAAQVEIVMTEQGLRIELVESGDGDLFFGFGSASLTPAAQRALRVIASELAQTTAPVVVEGHTDAAPFGSSGYSNWELSADRANAARRALEQSGLRSRVREVRGYADHNLRIPDRPLDPANRRTTVLLPFTTSVPERPQGEVIPTGGTT